MNEIWTYSPTLNVYSCNYQQNPLRMSKDVAIEAVEEVTEVRIYETTGTVENIGYSPAGEQ